MAATVLKSQRAVEMSVFVVRAFVRLRQMAGHEHPRRFARSYWLPASSGQSEVVSRIAART